MLEDLPLTISAIENQRTLMPTIPPHFHMKKDQWTMSGWRQDEVSFNPRHIIDEIEKLEFELYNDVQNNRVTTARPRYFEVEDNVLTLIGLTQSAKRDTAEVSTSNRYVSLGKTSTTAVEGNTQLNLEMSAAPYARKDLSTEGQRKVVNQTAKYGVLFDDGDVEAPPVDIKEAGLHWASSGNNNMHAHVTFTTYSMTTGDLFVIQINELQANG